MTRRQDYSAHVRKHPSPSVRLALLLAGTGFVVAGVAGLFLPVLPTTPFLLVAAAFYARASHRFYNWLLNNRLFGPAILEWRQYRSIRYRTKIAAILLMSATLASSIVFFVEDPRLQAALVLLGIAVTGDGDACRQAVGPESTHRTPRTPIPLSTRSESNRRPSTGTPRQPARPQARSSAPQPHR